MFGLAPWFIIAWLVTAALVPLGYQAGHVLGARDQAAEDAAANELAQAQAVAMALQKQADDNARVVLRQVEATGRERDARKAIESKTVGLESEALEMERRLAEFTCPAAVPAAPSLLPAVIADGGPPPPVVVAPRCDPSLGDDDLGWLRKNFPPGRISRSESAAASGRGK